LTACSLLLACAQAQQPPVPKTAAAMPAIADAEPDVAQQVSALLGRLGQGTFSQEQLTDNARTALPAGTMQAMAATLRACGALPAVELLRRTTKGEDRQYLYRLPCAGHPQLVEIDFNKGAKVNRLVLWPEQLR
jgi:hypothetical protein